MPREETLAKCTDRHFESAKNRHKLRIYVLTLPGRQAE